MARRVLPMTPEYVLYYALLERNVACNWVPSSRTERGRSDAIVIATSDAHHGDSKHRSNKLTRICFKKVLNVLICADATQYHLL